LHGNPHAHRTTGGFDRDDARNQSGWGDEQAKPHGTSRSPSIPIPGFCRRHIRELQPHAAFVKTKIDIRGRQPIPRSRRLMLWCARQSCPERRGDGGWVWWFSEEFLRFLPRVEGAQRAQLVRDEQRALSRE